MNFVCVSKNGNEEEKEWHLQNFLGYMQKEREVEDDLSICVLNLPLYVCTLPGLLANM